MLLGKGVPESTIQDHLTITQGDVLDVNACKGPLTLNNRPADVIISGIGMVNMSELWYGSTLCGDATTNILAALEQLKLAKKPLLVVLSTTGITNGPRDVPLLFTFLYHVLLASPHKDKKKMENIITEHAKSSQSAISGFVVVKPSLLMDGEACGTQLVRMGTEQQPAIGYTIRRNDVGQWMYENLIGGDGHRFAGQKLSLTY